MQYLYGGPSIREIPGALDSISKVCVLLEYRHSSSVRKCGLQPANLAAYLDCLNVEVASKDEVLLLTGVFQRTRHTDVFRAYNRRDSKQLLDTSPPTAASEETSCVFGFGLSEFLCR